MIIISIIIISSSTSTAPSAVMLSMIAGSSPGIALGSD
jgi:hypothetical protein